MLWSTFLAWKLLNTIHVLCRAHPSVLKYNTLHTLTILQYRAHNLMSYCTRLFALVLYYCMYSTLPSQHCIISECFSAHYSKYWGILLLLLFILAHLSSSGKQCWAVSQYFSGPCGIRTKVAAILTCGCELDLHNVYFQTSSGAPLMLCA